MLDPSFLTYRRLILKFRFVYVFAQGAGVRILGRGAESISFIEAVVVNV
jgi:hypothetical protein